MSLLSENNR